VWGDVDQQAQGIDYGTSPSYHPLQDRMAFRGCDETGNRCGIWTMSTSGGDPAPLTNVPADDRPRWAPNGAFAVFMSDGRHGNMEIYRVDVGSGAVTRLTDSPALDVTPVVSPDSQWVAFFSNRSGAWAIWAMPSSGGEAQLVLELPGGIGNWSDQGLQWIN
jgi:Tol biopolymer transport system component